MQIWRIPRVIEYTGRARTPIYVDIQNGLLTKPIKIGPRAVGIPSTEVEAVMKARIAGKTDGEIRKLVQDLHAARNSEVA